MDHMKQSVNNAVAALALALDTHTEAAADGGPSDLNDVVVLLDRAVDAALAARAAVIEDINALALADADGAGIDRGLERLLAAREGEP